MLLQYGDRGSAVRKLQIALHVDPDGKFGDETKKALIDYQTKYGLDPDGVAGPKVFTSLGLNLEPSVSTDLSNSSVKPIVTKPSSQSFFTIEGLAIWRHYLRPSEYISGGGTKKWLVLHHTAGGHNPFAVVDQWDKDQRGRIATRYVIGGISTSNRDAKMDGLVVECMPDSAWAYHLGPCGNSRLHPDSVAIEVCNYGYLTKGADGKFRNYVNSVIPDDMVCDLGFEFKGKQYYHNYTDLQISNLILLIKEISRVNPDIDLKGGLSKWLATDSPATAFGFKSDAYYGKEKGIFVHGNVLAEKSDMYPHPKLVSFLKTL